MKTYQNAIDEAREILQDTVVEYRYSDATMLNILNRALQEVGRIRPDAYWADFETDDISIPEIEIADLGNAFTIPMQFFFPIVSFIVAWAEVLDDEFTADGRADMLIKQFKTQVLAL